MKFGRSLARNIDFEVATFRLLLKTSRKREFLTYNLSKLREFDCTYFDFHSTNLYISDCFDLCVVNMRMSIRVRGLHLVCFQLADTLWHESPASNLAQVNAWWNGTGRFTGTRIHSKQSADSRHLEGFKKLLMCTWLVYLMHASHSDTLSTGLAASQEMLLRATCLQIKATLGFPKRKTVVRRSSCYFIYVQPCCPAFHTSNVWGLDLPNGMQSWQAKIPARWTWQSKPFQMCPFQLNIASSEVGSRSLSKDYCRRAPKLLLRWNTVLADPDPRVQEWRHPACLGILWAPSFFRAKFCMSRWWRAHPRRIWEPCSFQAFSFQGSQTAGIG